MTVTNFSFDVVKEAFDNKRKFFDDGKTMTYKFRLDALKKLRSQIKIYERQLLDAMYLDYKKPATEAFVGDIGVVLEELNFTIKNLKIWMQDRRVPTPITLMPSTSKVIYEPKGVVVIFAPWNYPFNLIITPLIGAIAAGNCAILKPAHETPHTAIVIEKLIKETFDPAHVSLVQGEGKAMGEMLLENFVFNHIFFTGSASTGKWILSKAAQNLTPVTLELGGKCPAIIDDSARLSTTVGRIVWAKYFNAGQTCLAIDHVFVHESIKDMFIDACKKEIINKFGSDPSQSQDFCRIVNSERTQNIVKLLEGQKILHGGKFDVKSCYIEPTIVEVTDINAPIMCEEIFGPILPVIFWKNQEDVKTMIRRNRYPLACYVFSERKKFIEFFHRNIEFGGGCVNNAMAHYGNSHFGFGGVMSSGMGKYHGTNSFETFSNAKPILEAVSLIDLHIWYPPYSDKKLSIIRRVVG
jgi:aldehyde dehydrogenase (NAD+)